MGIRDQENQLFAEWSRDREGFIYDGLVDEAAYISSRPKLLFVLKEANDPSGSSWDLREFVREGARPQSWDTVTRWVEAIRKLPTELPWSNLSEITKDRRQNALRSICAMNINKRAGGHTSNPATLWQAANTDRAMIKRQLAIYDADLVICCGTTDLLQLVIGDETPLVWRETSRGVRFFEQSPSKFVISYSHPTARIASNILHYGIVDAVREILHPRQF